MNKWSVSDWTNELIIYHQGQTDEIKKIPQFHKFTRNFYVFLTCYLTAIKFEPQCNAILPRLRSDPDKAGQDRQRDAIEDHLCGICISMENLMDNQK